MSSAKSQNGSNTGKSKNPMDFDTILVEEVGQIGQFQLRILSVTCILVVFRAWCTNEYVFTAAKINTRCYIPGCDSNYNEYSPEWLSSAIPVSNGGFDNCMRYANTTELPADGTCPALLFDSSKLEPCESYIYETTNTVAYDFELACDEWRRTLIGSVRHLGMFAALLITGYISDRWGRRTALVFNSFNAAWLGIIRYWASNYYVYLLSMCLETTFAGGVFTSAYVIAMEIMGPKYRVIGAAFTNSLFSVGQIFLAMIAMAFPNWRSLTLAIYAPQFLSILSLLVLTESVRWSLSKGYYTRAEAVIKKIAKVNRRSVKPESLVALRQTYEEQKLVEVETGEKSRLLILDVLKNKTILLRLVISCMCWVANTFIYHGLSINAVSISGNRYLNYALAATAEIPGFWIGIYLLNKFGRKPVLVVGFLTCAASQAAYVWMPKDQYVLSLSVYLIGKFLSGMMVLSVYIYTTELYPTPQRHRLLAYSSFMGRIGAVLAPLTPAFGAATFDDFPFVLFGCGAFISGLLILLLPETLNTKLPDTMNEAENIGDTENTHKHV